MFKWLNVFGLKFLYVRNGHLLVYLPLQENNLVESVPEDDDRNIKCTVHISSYYGACMLFLYSQVKVKQLIFFANYHCSLINYKFLELIIKISMFW